MRRLLRDQPPPGPRRALEIATRLEQRGQLLERLDEFQLQPLPPLNHPVLVAVLRQEPLAVKLDRPRMGPRIAAPTPARNRGPKRVHVPPDPLRWKREKPARR